MSILRKHKSFLMNCRYSIHFVKMYYYSDQVGLVGLIDNINKSILCCWLDRVVLVDFQHILNWIVEC